MRTEIANKAILAGIIMVLAACSNSSQTNLESDGQRSDNHITVSGQVKVPQLNGKVVLSKLSVPSPQRLDSLLLPADGRFEFRVEVLAPEFYQLNFFDLQVVEVILDDTDVTINVDGDRPSGERQIKGSVDTEFFQHIVSMAQEFDAQVAQINQQYMEARSGGDLQKANELQSQYLRLNDGYGDRFKEAIWGMDNSIAAIYAVEFLAQRQQFSMDDNFQFLDSLNQRFQGVQAPILDLFREQVGRLEKLAIGSQAPEIALPDPDGNIVALSSLRGKYVMIDFWAAWCKPCRMENPNVVRLYNKYNDQGFEIYGVSLDRTREAWLKAIEADGLTWNHVSDLKFWDSAVTKTYDIKGIPLTYLIDPEGKIIGKNLRGKSLEQKLEEIFG